MSTGKSIDWFGWPEVFAPSLAVTPSAPRSMPAVPLPWMLLPRMVTGPPATTFTPRPTLFATTLAPAVVPPMVTGCVDSIRMPSPPLPRAVVPSAPTPMWLPRICTGPSGLRSQMPWEVFAAITLRSTADVPPITSPVTRDDCPPSKAVMPRVFGSAVTPSRPTPM